MSAPKTGSVPSAANTSKSRCVSSTCFRAAPDVRIVAPSSSPGANFLGLQTVVPLTSDRGFESLQRRVRLSPEAAFLGREPWNSYAQRPRIAPRTATEPTLAGGPRVRILLPPAESQRRSRAPTIAEETLCAHPAPVSSPCWAWSASLPTQRPLSTKRRFAAETGLSQTGVFDPKRLLDDRFSAYPPHFWSASSVNGASGDATEPIGGRARGIRGGCTRRARGFPGIGEGTGSDCE